ncbi:hypothetical protein WJX84_006589 [Apatococcus fuscideae]
MFPQTSAPLVDAYRSANGIILGKTRMHELSAGATSISPTTANFTAVLNPYNVTHHPGGSSGGSAAGVAARLAPWALCEDTGGSCRLPASASGVLGFRPTLGCYNHGDGLVPASFTRDTVGAAARGMEDLILLDSIVRDSDAMTRANGALLPPGVSCQANVDRGLSFAGMRIGLPMGFWASLDPAIIDVLENATDHMSRAGAEMVPLNLSSVISYGNDHYGGALSGLNYFETPRELSR